MPTADDLKLSMCSSLAQMGDNHVQLGQLDKAIDYFQQALSIARESAEPSLQRRILVSVAMCTLRQSDFLRAVETYEQARKVGARAKSGEALVSPSGEAQLLIELGRGFYGQGDIERAVAYLGDAAGLAAELRAAGERSAERVENLARANLGIILSGQGDMAQLRDLCSAAFGYAQSMGDDLVMAVAQVGLGLYHTLMGQSGEALDLLNGALAKLRPLGEPALEAEARAYRCWCLAEAGRPDGALALLDLLPTQDDQSAARRVRCAALIGTGLAQALSGRAEQALVTCRDALTLAQDVLGRGDQLGYRLAGRALYGLGVASSAAGQTAEAMASHRQALAMTDTVDDRVLRVRAMLGIGEAQLGSDPQGARITFEDARSQAIGLANPVAETMALAGLGQVEAALGDPQAAVDFFRMAAAIAEKTGDLHSQLRVALLSGDSFRATGRRDLALDRYQNALGIIRAGGLDALEDLALGGLGLCLVDSGDPGKAVQAIQYLTAALARAQAHGSRHLSQTYMGGLGAAYAISGQPNQAIEQYRQAITSAQETGDRAGEGVWLGNLANLYAYIDQPARAVETFQAAIQIGEETGDRAGQARLMVSLGLAWSDLDRIHEAIAVLRSALAIFDELGDAEMAGHAQRFLDQLGG